MRGEKYGYGSKVSFAAALRLELDFPPLFCFTSSRHFAAVYALFRFANNLRLNIQLPPQTRDYWAALEKEKADTPKNKMWLWSTTPFETAAEAPPPRPLLPVASTSAGSSIPSHLNSTSNSTSNSPFASPSGSASTSRSSTPLHAPANTSHSARTDKHWSEAPEVRMPTALRDLVEETIRSMMHRFPSTSLAIDESGFSDLSIASPSTPEDDSILQELTTLGFRKGHTLNALSYVHSARNSGRSDPLLRSISSLPLRVAVLEYLHLHTPEEDLPPSFRTSRPADATARIATNKDSEALANSWKAEALARETGMPIGIVEKAMRESEGEEGVAVDLMVRRLMGWSEGEEEILSDVSYLDGLVMSRAEGAQDTELVERRNDELAALEGIFGETCRRTDKGIEILVSSNRRRRQDSTADQVILRVLFHPASLYPTPSSETESPNLPTFYVYSSTLPAYIRLHLTALIASQLTNKDSSWMDLAKGGYGGLVCEMANHLQEVFQEAIENPPDSREVLSKLLGSRIAPTLESNAGTKQKKDLKPKFRPFRPSITPQAQEMLRQKLEDNSKKPGYGAMLGVRMKLPAWSMREEIVELIKSNRVVIVSGETGSGKTTQGKLLIFPIESNCPLMPFIYHQYRHMSSTMQSRVLKVPVSI